MEKRYKRPFDLGVLLFAHLMPLTGPICLLVWTLVPLLIWLEDRGPVFYRQKRLGKDGRVFEIVKFRTMIIDAEKETGAVLSVHKDPRVTLLGRWLRKLHIDEFPQIINIIRGEMSLVGPRPERPELHELISKELPTFKQRLCVKPGIAGMAQVYGAYSADPATKLRHDIAYVGRMSARLDVWLLILSVMVTLRSILVKGRSKQAKPISDRYPL